jgi:hypothetical protein
MSQLVRRFSNFGLGQAEDKVVERKQSYIVETNEVRRRTVQFDIPDKPKRRRSSSRMGMGKFEFGAGMGGRLAERLRGRD